MDYFIKALGNDVPVVKKLPLSVKGAPKVIKQFKSWSNVKYFEEEIGRLWHNYKVRIPFQILLNCSSFSDRMTSSNTA
jgi:uncharacterized Zn ribbon protein